MKTVRRLVLLGLLSLVVLMLTSSLLRFGKEPGVQHGFRERPHATGGGSPTGGPPLWLKSQIALQERFLATGESERPPLTWTCISICSGWGDRFYYYTLGLISAIGSHRPFFAHIGFPENGMLFYAPRYFAWNLTEIPTISNSDKKIAGIPWMEDEGEESKKHDWTLKRLFDSSAPLYLNSKFKFGKPILQNQEEFSLSVGGPSTEIEGQLFYALFRPTELIYQAFLEALESLAWQLDVVDRGILASDFLDEPKFRYFFFEEFGRDPSHRRTFGEIFVEYGNPEYHKVDVPQLASIHSRTRPSHGFEHFTQGIKPLNFNNIPRVVPCAKQLAPTVLDPTRKIAYFCASDSVQAKKTQQEQGCITLETTAKPQHIAHPKHSLENVAAGVAEMIMLSLSDMLIGTHSGYVSWAKFMNYIPTSRSFRYPPFQDIRNCAVDLKNNYYFKDFATQGLS